MAFVSTQSEWEKRMDKNQIREASKMWRAGEEGSVIAKRFGITPNHLFDIASQFRPHFPHRNKPLVESEIREYSFLSDLPDHCMHWITISGASVTLPKISMASCPRIGQ